MFITVVMDQIYSRALGEASIVVACFKTRSDQGRYHAWSWWLHHLIRPGSTRWRWDQMCSIALSKHRLLILGWLSLHWLLIDGPYVRRRRPFAFWGGSARMQCPSWHQMCLRGWQMQSIVVISLQMERSKINIMPGPSWRELGGTLNSSSFCTNLHDPPSAPQTVRLTRSGKHVWVLSLLEIRNARSTQSQDFNCKKRRTVGPAWSLETMFDLAFKSCCKF